MSACNVKNAVTIPFEKLMHFDFSEMILAYSHHKKHDPERYINSYDFSIDKKGFLRVKQNGAPIIEGDIHEIHDEIGTSVWYPLVHTIREISEYMNIYQKKEQR